MNIFDDLNLNYYLVYWCMNGLQYIDTIDAQRINMEELDAAFGDRKEFKQYLKQLSTMIEQMRLSAMYNPQRHYELYILKTSEEISENDIRGFFEEHPQAAANMVREKGIKMFSYRNKPDREIKIR